MDASKKGVLLPEKAIFGSVNNKECTLLVLCMCFTRVITNKLEGAKIVRAKKHKKSNEEEGRRGRERGGRKGREKRREICGGEMSD